MIYLCVLVACLLKRRHVDVEHELVFLAVHNLYCRAMYLLVFSVLIEGSGVLCIPSCRGGIRLTFFGCNLDVAQEPMLIITVGRRRQAIMVIY